MHTNNILQDCWSSWNECWANDLLAMAMAVFCSQQVNAFIRRLYRRCVGGTRLIITSSDSSGVLELPLAKEASWSQLLFNLGYAVQFPITVAFHPLVTRPKIIDGTLCPSLPQLICQITVFLFIDHSIRLSFAKIYGEAFDHGDCNDEEPHNGASSAVEVATDFTAPGTTVLFAVTIIQFSSRLRYLTGGLHFAAILCWLLIRI